MKYELLVFIKYAIIYSDYFVLRTASHYINTLYINSWKIKVPRTTVSVHLHKNKSWSI